MDSLLTIINEVLDEAGREPAASLQRVTDLRKDLGLDSLELAVLTVKIESIYGVDVFADGIVNTVGEVQDKIDGR